MPKLILSLMALFLLTAVARGQQVELELVLALDSSSSVDSREYELQRSGLAWAFRSKPVKQAIAALGGEGMAIAVIQWSGPGQQVKALDWRRVASDADADALAARLQSMPRALKGFTDISGAIVFATNEILNNTYSGARLAIDVSGDGVSEAADPRAARDIAIEQGITINGLTIASGDYNLGILAVEALIKHYRERVIGGPGHFLIETSSYSDFAEAIQRKLVREITGAAFTRCDCPATPEPPMKALR